ncbi:MAG: SCO family protein [Pseudomonadota bacterium]
MKFRMNARLGLVAFVGCSVLALTTTRSHADDALPYYNSAEFTPYWIDKTDDALAQFHAIPPFSFTDQNGEIVDDATVDNHVYVASFFFSTCPGICPTMQSKLTTVQEHFRDEERVLILSHSIRPDNDTTEVLQAYARRNGVDSERWKLLTGQQSEIYALAKSAYFANEDLGNIQDLKDFLHTENLLLIDRNRHIRGVYNGLSSSSVAHLIADIDVLLDTPRSTMAAVSP